jgi:L-ascorbate metabolism protein UlaG (beta-lactamase superfamily)
LAAVLSVLLDPIGSACLFRDRERRTTLTKMTNERGKPAPAPAAPPAGVVRLRWLGQAGFVVEAGGVCALVDPWFAAHELRLTAAPAIGDLPEVIDWLLVTHEHGDHFDLPAIAELALRRSAPRVVVPSPLVDRVHSEVPYARVEGVQPGDRLQSIPLCIDVVPAWHGLTVSDGYSAGPVGQPTPHVGYLLRFQEGSVYHAGDTIASEKLIETLGGLGVDIAILPINGRNSIREAQGIVGNLGPEEAARFAAEINARIVIPMHYEMVRGNTQLPGALVDAVARLDLAIHVIVMNRLRPLEIFLGASK